MGVRVRTLAAEDIQGLRALEIVWRKRLVGKASQVTLRRVKQG